MSTSAAPKPLDVQGFVMGLPDDRVARRWGRPSMGYRAMHVDIHGPKPTRCSGFCEGVAPRKGRPSMGSPIDGV